MTQPNRLLLIAGILLVATTLRAPFTIIAPLLEGLQQAYALGETQIGLLITGPVLAFAAVSPFAAILARRFGPERTLMGAMAVIAAGVLLRAGGGVTALYAGTVIIGAGIALGNVLLPSLLKQFFPTRVATLTALYVLTMGLAAAAGSVLVAPLLSAFHGNWRYVSCAPLVLVALAALVWLPQVARGAVPAAAESAARGAPRAARSAIWRTRLAWQVTAYLGLDCFLYYVGVSWLPSIVRDTAAYSPAQAASLHGVLLLATALPGLVLIPLVPRLRDQSALAAGLALCMSAGLIGFVLAPAHALVWTLLFGIGAGGGLIMALALIGLRTAHAADSTALSAMAQGVGYLFAAAGPPLVGKANEVSASWTAPLCVCAALGVAMALAGILAGRNRQIGEPDGVVYADPHHGSSTPTQALKADTLTPHGAHQ